MDYLVHLTTMDEWEAARQRGVYQAASLEAEGFIHLSRPDQLLAVANRFYRSLTEALLLWILPEKLTSEIRWEQADGELFPGELFPREKFPHLYGPLNLEAVSGVTPLRPDEDGVYRVLPSHEF
jgi:uncharacterized protein (DUF952 family)